MQGDNYLSCCVRCPQVEHAALLERLHAKQQQYIAGGGNVLTDAQLQEPQQADANGDTPMGEAGAHPSAAAPTPTWPSVREFLTSQLRTDSEGE